MDVVKSDGHVASRRHRAMQQIFGLNEGAGAMSSDKDHLKKRVRKSIEDGPSYSVENYYSETGWCQRVARNQHFETLSLAVIALNAIWVWVDTDYNDAQVLTEADLIFQVVEHFFCLFF